MDGKLSEVIRRSGHRATKGRVELLRILEKSGTPLPVREISRVLKNKFDIVTLYRALQDFANSGVIKRVDLNMGVARYEYTPGKRHHHHIVCTNCQKVADLDSCDYNHILYQSRAKISGFSRITDHSLELFGVCNKCAIN